MRGALRVCFLTAGVPAADRPPGDLIRRLPGHDVTVALTHGVPPGSAEVALGAARAVAVSDAAAGEPFDIAVATDWGTTAELFTIPAARYAFWADRLAFRAMGTWQAERFAAQLAYDLPVDFVATGDWLAAELAELRPDARCLVVPRAVDREVFGGAGVGAAPGGSLPGAVATDAVAPAAGATALRVVVDDRWRDDPSGSDERAAVAQAIEALASDASAGDAPSIEVSYLERGDDAPARAAKLAGADVVLMLSPVDGALGGPLEGFVAGATCIVASAPDAADLVEHDVNGLVADPDDVRGVARRLELLARDPALLARLRAGARTTGASWPTPDDAAARLAEALERLVAEPPPDATRWPVRLMGDAIGGAAVMRQEIAALTAEINRLRGDDAYRTAVAVRAKLQSPRLGPVRRALGPLVRRLRG
jgi:hypothetical protein